MRITQARFCSPNGILSRTSKTCFQDQRRCWLNKESKMSNSSRPGCDLTARRIVGVDFPRKVISNGCTGESMSHTSIFPPSQDRTCSPQNLHIFVVANRKFKGLSKLSERNDDMRASGPSPRPSKTPRTGCETMTNTAWHSADSPPRWPRQLLANSGSTP